MMAPVARPPALRLCDTWSAIRGPQACSRAAVTVWARWTCQDGDQEERLVSWETDKQENQVGTEGVQ